MIAPALTFASSKQTLDVSTMFTSLSFIKLLTYPLLQIFEGVPQTISGVACLGRIQAFLECETRDDFRQVLADIKRDSEKSSEKIEVLSDSALVVEN